MAVLHEERRLGNEACTALVERFYDEIWNRGCLERWEEFLDEDEPLDPCDSSLGTYKSFVIRWRRAAPDLHWTLHDLISTGDCVAWCASMRWTNPTTGQLELVDAMSMCRIVNGKMTDRVTYASAPRTAQSASAQTNDA
jgi:hypothetical protein